MLCWWNMIVMSFLDWLCCHCVINQALAKDSCKLYALDHSKVQAQKNRLLFPIVRMLAVVRRGQWGSRWCGHLARVVVRLSVLEYFLCVNDVLVGHITHLSLLAAHLTVYIQCMNVWGRSSVRENVCSNSKNVKWYFWNLKNTYSQKLFDTPFHKNVKYLFLNLEICKIRTLGHWAGLVPWKVPGGFSCFT